MLPAEVARLRWITPSSGMRTVLTVCWLLLCNIIFRRLGGGGAVICLGHKAEADNSL